MLNSPKQLQVAHPNAVFYFHEDGEEVPGMINDYEEGKCEVLAIGWEDNTMDLSIREALCDNDLVFTDSLVIETPTAFPINPDLASGFSYWMYQAEKKHGISITKMNEEYLEQVNKATSCPLKLSEQDGSGGEYDKITVQNFTLPLILYACAAGIAIVLQIYYTYAKSRGKASLIGRTSQLNLATDQTLSGQNPINSVIKSVHKRRKTGSDHGNKSDSEDDESKLSDIEEVKLPQSVNGFTRSQD